MQPFSTAAISAMPSKLLSLLPNLQKKSYDYAHVVLDAPGLHGMLRVVSCAWLTYVQATAICLHVLMPSAAPKGALVLDTKLLFEL